MMPASSHGPEPIIVEIEGVGELEFPGDTDPSVIQAKVKELTTPAHENFGKYGPLSLLMHDQAHPDEAREKFKSNLPMLGAGIASALTAGAGLIPTAIAAGGGGFLGARARGDSRSQATVEGLKQGALEGGAGLVGKGLKLAAPPMYRAAVPKPIQDKFGNLAPQGLKERIWMGTHGGTRTAANVGNAAAGDIAAAAPSVRPISGADVQDAFKPKYNRALTAGKVDAANEINAHVRKSMDEVGSGFTGTQQLARKEFLEQEGRSAMTAPNSNMAAVNPQLANIERRAITKNLRMSPQMEAALNRSQGAIGLTRAAKATENSSLLNRLSHGGIWNAARSPAGLSGAAIGMNELANIPFAQLVRMAQIAAMSGEQDQ